MGEYSIGGSCIYWSKTGKVWNGLRQLKSHLSYIIKQGNKHGDEYKDCEIVEYEVVEINSYPVEAELHEIEMNKK